MVNTFVPRPVRREFSNSLVPCVNVTTAITAATPTITPRTVSSERRRFAQSASHPLSSPAPIISPRWAGAFFCGAGARPF